MKKKLLAILLTVCMVFSMAPAALAAGYQDIDGHWAEDAINRWSQAGIVQGNDGKFDPYGQMTRGQAAVVFANLLGLEKQGDLSGFSDVADTWYTEALAKCYAAGIILGSGSQMDPNGLLTREQFFTMFGRALGLGEHDEMNRDFHDAHTVSDWAEGHINALVNKGYIDGMTETTIEPGLNINRASVMSLLDKTIVTYVTEDGAVEAPAAGGVVVVAADNVTITGEFSGTVITVGGDTNVEIENATAEAEVIVASGADNVTVSGEFSGTVTVAAPETTVTVENATEDAKVVVNAANTTVDGDIKGTVEVAEGATDTTVAADAGTVAVTGEGASVAVSGNVTNVEVKEEATGAAVEVKEEAKVENLTTNAADSSVAVSGTVEKVEVKETASNANVTTETTAKVENVTTNATGTTVSGTGTVDKVQAGENATGTTVNTSGSKVENNSAEDVTVGTGTVESGSTGTSAGETSEPEVVEPTPSTPTEPEEEEPTTPSTPSGPSEPVHFCSYTGVVTKPATCTETGVKTFTCSCSNSYTETIPMVEHEIGVQCQFCGITEVTTADQLIAAVAKGGKVQLMANIELAETAVVPADKTVELNLNNFNITVGFQSGSETNHIYAIENNGTMTLKGTGTITARGVKNIGAGDLTVENGVTIVACDSNGGAAIWNEATLTINGGTFNAPYVGTVEDAAGPGCLNNSGTATVNGGKFESKNARTYAIISSGTLELNDASVTTGNHGAVAIDDGEATINGGSYVTTVHYAVYSYDGDVTINNGSFDGGLADFCIEHNGTITAKGGTYSEDISDYVADGYIAIKDVDADTWTVQPIPEDLPVANVVNSPEYEYTYLPWGEYGQWSPTEGLEAMLKAAYTFSCTEEVTAETPYADWYCDFYVKLDQDLGANEIFLGGNYGTFGWVGFHNGDLKLSANEEIPLLGGVTNNPWTYLDVATNVGTFICGVGDVENALTDATFTVMLRLTNPENETEFYDVATIEYTFEEVAVTKVGTPKELERALHFAEPGTIIMMEEDVNYGKVYVGSGHGITEVPDNLTIVGASGASVDLAIRSGFNIDGWTFGGVTFAGDGFHINNGASADNLTIKNCVFGEGTMLYTMLNKGGYVKDVTIFGCEFSNNQKSAIICQNATNVTVSGCTFTNAGSNAVQMTATKGNIVICDNEINGTTDRPLRFSNESATITVSNNEIVSEGDSEHQMMKVSGTIDVEKIILGGNTWNGLEDAELVYAEGVWTLPEESTPAAE